MLFLHDAYNDVLPSAVMDAFNIDFSHAHSTRASTQGLINSVSSNLVAYGTGSMKNQAIAAWNSCQKALPARKFFDLSRNQLKKALTDSFLNTY